MKNLHNKTSSSSSFFLFNCATFFVACKLHCLQIEWQSSEAVLSFYVASKECRLYTYFCHRHNLKWPPISDSELRTSRLLYPFLLLCEKLLYNVVSTFVYHGGETNSLSEKKERNKSHALNAKNIFTYHVFLCCLLFLIIIASW